MIQSIVAFILLFAPTIRETWNDRKGDFNKGADVIIRIVIGLLAALISSIILNRYLEPFNIHHIAGRLVAFNMSMAIFFLFFDYLISYILIHNGTIELPRGSKQTWFNYTAKSGFVDRVPWWSKLNPYVKLLIRVVYFILSAVLYFKR